VYEEEGDEEEEEEAAVEEERRRRRRISNVGRVLVLNNPPALYPAVQSLSWVRRCITSASRGSDSGSSPSAIGSWLMYVSSTAAAAPAPPAPGPATPMTSAAARCVPVSPSCIAALSALRFAAACFTRSISRYCSLG
jgi:hypothetical protein